MRAANSVRSQEIEHARRLHREIGGFRCDPLGYVMYAFPWRQPGTALAEEDGPEDWQRDVLDRLGSGLLSVNEALRLAMASGHGIGKSALVAWIILWAMSTVRDTRGIGTANTEGQLRSKTWPEPAKWYGLCVNRHWFTYTATALHSAMPGHERTWRVDAITWSENNTEAIAGLHNKGKRAFALFDEASAIPKATWDTIKGALTDANTDLFWAVFGNPTRTPGRFRECFAGERLEAAVRRPLVSDPGAPLVMGVDIARHGEDQSLIRCRRGLDARSIPPLRFRLPDLMQVASRVMEQVALHKPDAVFVDSTGIGWGVPDRLRQLGCPLLVGVDFAGRADRRDLGDAGARYANKRAGIWGLLKEWCKAGCLPDDPEFVAELGAVEYGYDAADAIILERKDDMRRRGLASPDDADALALTFAHPVFMPDPAEERRYEEKLRQLKRRIV
jgi:hypothetical protein